VNGRNGWGKHIPLLASPRITAHHRKEGRLRHQEMLRSILGPAQTGWFSFRFLSFKAEPHPGLAKAVASRYFFSLGRPWLSLLKAMSS
jgi:hypothetical protein